MARPRGYGEIWAAFYDDLHPPPPEEVLQFIMSRASDGPVLELAVGTGRIAIPLMDAGLEVHGVEISPSMIARLRDKDGDRLPIVGNDMTSFSLSHRYPLVLLAFNTLFGATEPEAQAGIFTCTSTALDPGGVFVVDCFVPDLDRFHSGQAVRVSELTDDRVRIDYSVHDSDRQVIRTMADFRWLGGRAALLPVTVRYLWPDQIDELAGRAGLQLVERYEWYDEAPFTDASSRHVSVYRKD